MFVNKSIRCFWVFGSVKTITKILPSHTYTHTSLHLCRKRIYRLEEYVFWTAWGIVRFNNTNSSSEFDFSSFTSLRNKSLMHWELAPFLFRFELSNLCWIFDQIKRLKGKSWICFGSCDQREMGGGIIWHLISVRLDEVRKREICMKSNNVESSWQRSSHRCI